MSTMTLHSKGPHDFYLTLDVPDYFEQEYDFEDIDQGGFARPLCLTTRDVLVVATYNHDMMAPAFTLQLPDQDAPDDAERAEILNQMGRVLGTGLDLEGFERAMQGDEVLSEKIARNVGFKRLARANVFEDAMRKIIHMRMAHRQTRQRMVRDVREKWGTSFQWRGRTYWSYPRPEVVAQAEASEFRDFGISTKKGEYIIGMAREIVEGELDLDALDEMDNQAFFDRVTQIKGIGPSAAQFLLLRRNQNSAIFVSQQSKKKEVGMLKWLLPHYGLDANTSDAQEIAQVTERWKGWEILVSQTFYIDWLMRELERKHAQS